MKMKEINLRFMSLFLMKMSLFTICQSSNNLIIDKFRCSIAHSSTFPFVLSLYSVHILGTYPILVEGEPRSIYKASRVPRSTNVAGNQTKENVTVVSSSTPATLAKTSKKVVEKTLVIPDRSPPNTSFVPKGDGDNSGETDENGEAIPSNSGINKKAIERAIIVIAGIAVIIVAYLGIQCFLRRGRKGGSGRYGIVETSEMDLLDKMEEEEEDESEEEELFDINRHRRTF